MIAFIFIYIRFNPPLPRTTRRVAGYPNICGWRRDTSACHLLLAVPGSGRSKCRICAGHKQPHGRTKFVFPTHIHSCTFRAAPTLNTQLRLKIHIYNFMTLYPSLSICLCDVSPYCLAPITRLTSGRLSPAAERVLDSRITLALPGFDSQWILNHQSLSAGKLPRALKCLS